MGEAEDVGLTSEELFRGAMAPEAPAPSSDPAEAVGGPHPDGLPTAPQGVPPAAEPGTPDELQLDAEGRLRNSRGQFASPQQVADHNARRGQPGVTDPQQFPQGGPQPPSPDGQEPPMVPTWRMREQTERHQAQLASMQQQYDRMLQMVERMSQPPQRQAPPQQAPQLPDPVIDPVGYQRGMEEQFSQGLRAVMLENNLRMTALEVGKANFQAAYDAFLEAGRQAPDFARSVVNDPDPGERIMNWYNNQRVLQEIGGNPQQWMARQLEAALANPQFLARAVEAAQNQARGLPPAGSPPPQPNARPQPQQQNGQARHAVVLPPSLSNMRGASGDGGANGGTVDYGHGVSLSDNDLFRSAMAPPAPGQRR